MVTGGKAELKPCASGALLTAPDFNHVFDGQRNRMRAIDRPGARQRGFNPSAEVSLRSGQNDSI